MASFDPLAWLQLLNRHLKSGFGAKDKLLILRRWSIEHAEYGHFLFSFKY
jgi:hypothetical protein